MGSWWKAEIISNYGSNGNLQYRLLGEDGSWGDPTNLWNGWNWYLLDNGIYKIEDRDEKHVEEILKLITIYKKKVKTYKKDDSSML